jgi:hypothetical protein
MGRLSLCKHREDANVADPSQTLLVQNSEAAAVEHDASRGSMGHCQAGQCVGAKDGQALSYLGIVHFRLPKACAVHECNNLCHRHNVLWTLYMPQASKTCRTDRVMIQTGTINVAGTVLALL